MVKWRRAPASRDGTHPLGPRALELRTTARPPRGDRAAARRAGARPGRGAEAVRRGHRAAPRGTRAADRRRGAGEAGEIGRASCRERVKKRGCGVGWKTETERNKE